jgi:transmembrane sensor
MYSYIHEHTFPVSEKQPTRLGNMRLYSRWIAAAAVWVLVPLAFLYFHTKEPGSWGKVAKHKGLNSHQQGSTRDKRVVLTLADGSKVYLDNGPTGEIAQESGTSISKTVNGELVYSAPKVAVTSNQVVKYNVIATPRGGNYKIVLPDGTRVWLNAASSLKFPTAFSGNERSVELTGEGYFEVAKDKSRPFKVITPSRDGKGVGQEVEVLGTHFDINAYGDEGGTRTTLLEGRVKVTPALAGHASRTLVPGQQSSLNKQDIRVDFVDVESVMAWKSGYFVFDNKTLSTVMAELARWYDVDVYCESKLNDIRLGGYISQGKKLEEVLDLLALTRKIHFKVEGRRVIVMQ